MELSSLLPVLSTKGCPCRFPRFVFLVGFDFQQYKVGPVACGDTQILVGESCRGPHAFLVEKSEKQFQGSTYVQYSCKKCSASWEGVFTQYNINMWCSYLHLLSAPPPALGPAPAFPLPISTGLRGFDRKDIETCARNFRIAPVNECIEYLTQSAEKP